MRDAAVPANAGAAGEYATSSTPKSLADLDKEATRKPVALENAGGQHREQQIRQHTHMNTGTATNERALSREIPHMPWPLRQSVGCTAPRGKNQVARNARAAPGAAIAVVGSYRHENSSDDGAVHGQVVWNAQEGRRGAPKERDSRQEDSNGEKSLFKRFKTNGRTEYSADPCHSSKCKSACDHRDSNEDAANQAFSWRKGCQRRVAHSTGKR